MSSNTPNDPGKESDGSNGRRPNPNRNSNILKTEDMGIDPVEGGGDDGVTFDNLSDPTALLIFIKGQGIKIPRNGDPPTEDPRNTDYIDLENVQRAVDNMEASLNNVSNRQNPQSSAPVISSQRAVKRERQDSDKAQPEARASKKCRQDPEEAHQGAQAPDGEALRARHTGIQRSDYGTSDSPQVPIMNGEHMSYENMAHLPQVPRQVPPIPQMPSQVPDMNGWPVHHANLVHIPNTVGASQQPMMPMPQMGPQGHHMNRGQMHDTNMAYVPHAPPQWPPIPQMPGPQMSAQVPGMNGEHMLQSNGMPRQMRPRHVRPGHTQSGQRPTGQRPLRQRPNGQSPPGQRPPRP
ncbi:hypothetical protein FCULG_00008892 [Fusarium culmorum]|uniref:Uncharacterized protein n=1 Tax=Fusarium culmorum TaxID=5516 RepID=A0A2T4H054_FUSCU|nr:hypothetical protein FCULG_00008892 [Fusarium culmorum]